MMRIEHWALIFAWFVAALVVMGCSPMAPSAFADDYDRSTWRHWTDDDGDCLNTRHEVLAEESIITPTIQDCKVIAGMWADVYTGRIFTDPTALDVDHVVALADAHASGGATWSPERKRAYANDMTDPRHLAAVSSSVNRSKGARGPDEWMPAEACWYAAAYRDIKARWSLVLTADEDEALRGVSCDE